MDEEGSVDEASLSLKKLPGGCLGGPTSLGSVVDMLRKSPDAGISIHGGPVPAEADCGRGLV
jgi:hypothetical protein